MPTCTDRIDTTGCGAPLSASLSARSPGLLELPADLVPAIRKTAELAQEVAAASGEQSTGVAQINDAMSKMDYVTQRNATGTEQLAAQAQSLRQSMRFFRVGSDATQSDSVGSNPDPVEFASARVSSAASCLDSSDFGDLDSSLASSSVEA